jgi:hypothetical protein
MRKLFLLLPLLLIPVTGTAQELPQFEVFGGYSNMWANFTANNGNDFDVNGFNASVRENFNSWFAGDLDFSSFFGSENGAKTNTQTVTYGPVFSYRKHGNIVPFVRVMAGAERGGTNYMNISFPEWRLALMGGGGVDLKFNHNISFRLIQVDYVMSQFSNARQDNLRLSAGVIFNLGRKHKDTW